MREGVLQRQTKTDEYTHANKNTSDLWWYSANIHKTNKQTKRKEKEDSLKTDHPHSWMGD